MRSNEAADDSSGDDAYVLPPPPRLKRPRIAPQPSDIVPPSSMASGASLGELTMLTAVISGISGEASLPATNADGSLPLPHCEAKPDASMPLTAAMPGGPLSLGATLPGGFYSISAVSAREPHAPARALSLASRLTLEPDVEVGMQEPAVARAACNQELATRAQVLLPRARTAYEAELLALALARAVESETVVAINDVLAAALARAAAER